MDVLLSQSVELINSALAPASLQAYNRAWSKLLSFCKSHNIEEVLPLATDNLSCFITYLFSNGSPASSIASVLSAISYFHKLENVIDPTQSFNIKQLMTSIRKKSPSKDLRQPITLNILHDILKANRSVKQSKYDALLFESLFLLTFHFGLRISETTSVKHNLQLNHIRITKKKLLINFETFKNSFRNPEHNRTHELKSSSAAFCPVKSLNKFLAFRGREPGPLFESNGKPLSRKTVFNHLQLCLSLSGRQANLFNTHSLRIGAASFWSSKHCTDVQIKQLGRWNSNAFVKYLRGSIDHSL